jgi:purine-nucleoside phosphorylase
MVVSDIINWSLRSISRQPLHDLRSNGPVLDDRWQHAILSASTLAGVQLNRGVFAQMLGPSYETRAEIRMLRKCGADLVGMSSGVEARWASSIGMRVAMISLVTNTLTDTTVRTVSHDEVLEAGRSAEARVCIAVRCAIESLPLSV